MAEQTPARNARRTQLIVGLIVGILVGVGVSLWTGFWLWLAAGVVVLAPWRS